MKTITDRVDQVFAEWDRPDSPGCALAVIQDGKIIYKRGYGMANLEHNVPIKPETIFDIGSTSKQFTALSILLLARHGKLSLDDPIQKYLPEMPEYEKTITVRHLVHHTSGLRDYLTLMALANLPFENDYQEPVVVDLIARQNQLNFLPGEEHLYSNSGYFLMSEIVQRASGKNLRDFAEEHIFGPLGMKNSHFHNNFKEIVPNRASGYGKKKEGGFEIDMGIFDVMGDGAVYTNVEDLFLWDQNFYNNKLDGGGQDLIEQMQTVGVLNSGEKLEYAFGLMVSTYRGLKTVSHGGSWYGYRAQLLRFPEQRFSVICLANLGDMPPDSLCCQVADIYLENLLEAKEVEKGADDQVVFEITEALLQEKIGAYHSKEKGASAEVTAASKTLTLDTLGYKFTLVATTPDHFIAQDAPAKLDVYFEDGNKIMSVVIADGIETFTFTRIETVQLTAEELKEYEGSYFSSELNITYHFNVKEDQLTVTPETPFMKILKPTLPDNFSAGMPSIKFNRSENGKITGFKINAGRVKGILFEKVAS